jgi:hypothetical protein
LNRALRSLQGVLKEATRRGWGVVPCDQSRYYDHLGIAIEIREHRYPIELHEMTETIPFTDDEVTAWRTEWRLEIPRRAGRTPPAQLKRKRATGRLRLSLPRRHDAPKNGEKSLSDAQSANVSHASRRLVRSACSQTRRRGTKSSSRAVHRRAPQQASRPTGS